MSCNIRYLSLVMTIMATGCAKLPPETSGGQVDSQLGPEVRRENENNITVLEHRLKELVQAAKAQGNDAVRYLGQDFFLKADAASLQKDHLTAVLLFKALHQLLPREPLVTKRLALEYLQIGDLNSGRQYLSELVQNSDHFSGEFSVQEKSFFEAIIGEIDLNNQRENEGVTRLQLLASGKNNDVRSCLVLNQYYLSKDQYNDAQKYLQTCVKFHPKNSELHYLQGRYFLLQSKLNSAKRSFQLALKYDPQNDQAALATGLIFEEEGKYDQAINVYQKIIDEVPSSQQILEQLTNIYFNQEKFDLFIESAEKLVLLSKDDWGLRTKLAIVLAQKKDYSRAISLLQEVNTAIPDSSKVKFYLGTLYAESEKFREAIQYFSQINETDDFYQEMIVQTSKSYLALTLRGEEGDTFFKWAREALSKPTVNEEAKLVVGMNLATFLENKGDMENAFDIVSELSNNPYFGIDQEYYFAHLNYQKGNVIKAREILYRILQVDKKHSQALNFLGFSFLETEQDLIKAKFYLTQALKLAPTDGYILDSMGYYYYLDNQFQQALSYFQKAYSLIGPHPEISKHLALTYGKLKNYDLAIAHLEELQKIHATYPQNEIVTLLNNYRQLLQDQVRLPASN